MLYWSEIKKYVKKPTISIIGIKKSNFIWVDSFILRKINRVLFHIKKVRKWILILSLNLIIIIKKKKKKLKKNKKKKSERKKKNYY